MRVLAGSLVLLSLSGCSSSPSPTPVSPPEPTATAIATNEPAPSKPRYNITPPKGWTRSPHGDGERFVDPDGTLDVILELVAERDLDRAIDAAVERHDITLKERRRVSSAAGLDDDGSRVATFATDDQAQIAQVVAKGHGETAVVFVLRGPTKDFARRGAETLQLIESFELSGRKPLVLEPSEHQPLDAAKRDALFAYVDAVRRKSGVPGVAMAIVQGDAVDARGLGLREEGGKPVAADTQFMIGSVTKSFSTLLMATLVDDGKMRWDAPVTEMWPSFTLADAQATAALQMQHLFCACTGLPRNDFELVFEYRGKGPRDHFARLAELKPTTGFNETFQYNNQLTAVGGYIAGQVYAPADKNLARAYERALADKVLKPLGMTNTTLSMAAVKRRDNHAMPHRVVGTQTEVIALSEEEFAPAVAPAGGLWSTAEDMAEYVKLQLSRGVGPEGRIVSEDNLDRTQTPGVKIGAESAYGLGWILSETHGLKTVHHGGGTFGFGTQVVFFPEIQVGLFISGNRSPDGNVLRAAEGRLVEMLFDVDLKVRDKTETAIAERERLFAEGMQKVSDEAPPAALAGRYRNPTLGALAATMDGKRLRIDVGEWKAHLVPLVETEGKQRLRLLGGPLDGMPVRYELEPKPALIMSDGQHDFRFER